MKTSIGQRPPSFLKLIYGHNFSQTSLPSKKKITLEGTQEFQITLFGKENTTPSSKEAYKSLTKNLLLVKFIHTTLSYPALSTTFPCNLENKSSTSFTSQSFKGLEKQRFNSLPCLKPISTTHAFFEIAKTNKEG